jgi:hypothetical protein
MTDSNKSYWNDKTVSLRVVELRAAARSALSRKATRS